ncbi:MAG: YigZ family protein [bacterium]
MDDFYYTIKTPARGEIKIKGSRFLAECRPVASIEEVDSMLGQIRRREHAATHHCYAYRIGATGERAFKYSDDGEPSGTAGRPIYDVLLGRDLTNILIVVTRYFGGTRLGTGGLARAYAEAAGLAVEKSDRVKNFLTEALQVQIPFPLYDRLMKLVQKYSADQTGAEYSDQVALSLRVRRSRVDSLVADITELSGGKAVIKRDRIEDDR